MKIIPAIDLKDGKCVRLKQGRMDDETVYANDPMEVAVKWRDNGGEIVHIVDLDGAVNGVPLSFEIIKGIAESLGVPIQIGGGIRDRAVAESYLSLDGVKRIILGTIALKGARSCEGSGERLSRARGGRHRRQGRHGRDRGLG